MKKVGIIGASGYTGYELIKLLTKHENVSLEVLNSSKYKGKKVSFLHKDFKKNLKFTNYSIDEINKMNLDLLFFCTPNGVAKDLVKKIKKKTKVIDLSADFRFKNLKIYEKVYKMKHDIKKNKAAYGLPEIHGQKNKIKKAKLVANPGCYVTACILAALPIKNLIKYAIFDCCSGWSGAGKESIYAKKPSLLKDNIIAYKLTNHRHKYEIEEYLGMKVSFTPHVIDTYQGIMATCHFVLKKKENPEKIKKIFKNYYKNQPFVKITDNIPDIRDVQKTNNCNIGGFEIDENNQLVIVSVVDNLIKGASGQAVQNMNLMLGFKETEGLK